MSHRCPYLAGDRGPGGTVDTLSSMAVALACVSALMTLIGGTVAMRVQRYVNLVLGLVGGVILGIVAFDLIPDALRMAPAKVHNISIVAATFVAGFLALHIIEKAIGIHEQRTSGHADDDHDHGHVHVSGATAGTLAACALVAHSVVDGLSIGLAYQGGASLGLGVAIAVIAHDFADGFNTFTVTYMSSREKRRAVLLLIADAIAPVAGAVITLFIHPPESVLGPYLGFFAGFLLYLAASDILPAAHRKVPAFSTLGATVLGSFLIWIIVGFSG
jgi:zinc transporter ZupT